jgi:hypothetical protein
MAKLSVSAASRVAGVARSTLHRAIRAGRLSADADGRLDTTELLRAGYTLQRGVQQEKPGALQDATPRSSETLHPHGPQETQAASAVQQERDLLRLERDLLRQQLEVAQAREQAALEREKDAREREALLLQMLSQMQQQNQRLLDMPRTPPPPRSSPESQPAVSRPAVPREDPTSDLPPAARRTRRRTPGTMRARILALLHEHTAGLSAEEMRVYLRTDRPLGDVLQGMRRQHVVTTRGHGKEIRYYLP